MIIALYRVGFAILPYIWADDQIGVLPVSQELVHTPLDDHRVRHCRRQKQKFELGMSLGNGWRWLA